MSYSDYANSSGWSGEGIKTVLNTLKEDIEKIKADINKDEDTTFMTEFETSVQPITNYNSKYTESELKTALYEMDTRAESFIKKYNELIESKNTRQITIRRLFNIKSDIVQEKNQENINKIDIERYNGYITILRKIHDIYDKGYILLKGGKKRKTRRQRRGKKTQKKSRRVLRKI